MLWRLFKSLAIGAFLLFDLQCAKPPTVVKGEGRLGLVQFPDYFTRTGSDGKKYIVTTREYEVRQSSGPTGAMLLFGVKNYDDAYADNFNAVSLDGKFTVRPATKPEWEQAQRLIHTRQEDSLRDITITEEGVLYRGRKYAQRSQVVAQTVALPSRGGKWLAVFSDTSKDSKRPGIPGFSGGGRTAGELFVDVYDTSSGEKILAGSAPHRGGSEPNALFSHALWIEDRYLILPLDARAWSGGLSGEPGESCFLGILPD